ncbi:TPA: Hsp20/alpha crystallin family protein [Candidatus Nomurabacteria bacterium]|nr:MAG: Protein containing Heat shock protein Hsp20 protein [Parcubacteria bacterium RAAC4_OD1_1]HCY26677.1 Hsp20/alpha crystallin family protein [Candidatus Nomurabacteria bacterium]
MFKKKSFLERLTGGIRFEENEGDFLEEKDNRRLKINNEENEEKIEIEKESRWEEEVEAELTIDLYQTPSDIIVQTMVAGVQPDNLNIIITRDLITIKGKREENQSVNKDDYFVQELYWGSFSRTISLPEEINPEEAEAIEKHGLLIIRLPKIDKHRETKLKIKSI